MAMNDRDVLGRDWDAMVRDMERSRRVEPRRMPWISAKQPYTKVEEAPDPDEMVLDLILGKGTGDWKKDLAFGLMGPAGGAATELSGGQSGVLDWMPGGSVLKAGVTSAPLALGVFRRIGTTLPADKSVQKIRDIAQDVITRLSRADHPVTAQEAAEAVSNAVDLEGALRGSGNAKAQISDIVFKAMDIPTTNVIAPKKMNVSGMTTDVMNTAEVDARRSATKEALSKNYKKYKEDFANLPEDVKQRILLGAEEARKKTIDDAIAKGVPHRKIIDHIGPNAKANYIRTQTTAYVNSLQPQKQAKQIVVPNSVITPDEIKQIGRDAYSAALKDAKANGISENDARKIANLASDRAQTIAEHEIGGDILARRSAYNKTSAHNLLALFDMFEPDVQEEIMRNARNSGESVYNRYISSGASASEAAKAKKTAVKTAKLSATRKYVKELGFKSPNDPRLAQYSQLSRDGNHVLATQPVQPALAEAAAPVKGYVADVVEGAGKSMLDGIPDEEVEALLREYGETPTADRVFNREYLEELLREEGY